jgi:hypothetical protein
MPDSGDIPGIGKFVVLSDGSILVLEEKPDKRVLHKLDNPSGKVISQELETKKDEEPK